MKIKQIFTYILVLTIGLFSFTSCVSSDDYSIPPVPPAGFFKETFNSTKNAAGELVSSSSSVRPKLGVAVDYDNGSPVTYSDPLDRSDLRFVTSVNEASPFVWIPAFHGTFGAGSLVIDNLPTEGRTNITLKYKFNDGGVYNEGTTSNANKIILKCNNVEITVPDIPITTSNGRNKHIIVKLLIPDGTTKLELSNPTSNGFRIDDVELTENY